MARLLDLPTELLTHIFLLAFYSYRAGIWRTQPSLDAGTCVCQICPKSSHQRANQAAIPLNPFYVLSLTCKKLNPIATPLLYRDVALVRYTSIFKFEATLIGMPSAAAHIQRLIVVGGGECLNVNEVLRESAFEFILAKCQAVKEVWFQDLRGLIHIDPEISLRPILEVNPWPRVFSILAGLPQLTSLGFENCDIDLAGAPALPAITKLRCGHHNNVVNRSSSQFPSIRHLTLSGEDFHMAYYDFPESASEVVLDTAVSPKEALRTAALISSAKIFRFTLVDTLASVDYRGSNTFRMVTSWHRPKPSFEKIYITLHLFDYMTTRQKILDGLDKLLRSLDSPYVHLSLHLSDDRTFTKLPSETAIIRRFKRCLPSAKALEVEIAEMDFVVEEEETWNGKEKALLAYFGKVSPEKEYIVV